MNLREVLAQHRLMAVVRGDDPDAALESILVLAEAGIPLVEITVTSKDAVGLLLRARAELGPQAPLGAGGVLTETDVVQVEQAGASFVVTPGLVPAVAESVRLGLPVLVGALTPTEVVAASLAGASAVKLFPAALGGPAYLRTLREPFPSRAVCAMRRGGRRFGRGVPGGRRVGGGGRCPVAQGRAVGGDLTALRDRAAPFLAAVR